MIILDTLFIANANIDMNTESFPRLLERRLRCCGFGAAA